MVGRPAGTAKAQHQDRRRGEEPGSLRGVELRRHQLGVVDGRKDEALGAHDLEGGGLVVAHHRLRGGPQSARLARSPGCEGSEEGEQLATVLPDGELFLREARRDRDLDERVAERRRSGRRRGHGRRRARSSRARSGVPGLPDPEPDRRGKRRNGADEDPRAGRAGGWKRAHDEWLACIAAIRCWRVASTALKFPGSMSTEPEKTGLYDPAREHDACGVGFVVDLARPPSHTVVSKGIELLRRLAHRGATGADPDSGDGAGILTRIPHLHYERALDRIGVELPLAGDYGVAQVFLSRDPAQAATQRRILEEVVRYHGQRIIGWRDVPVRPQAVGPTGRASMPSFAQLFIARLGPRSAFERVLYLIQKRTLRFVGERNVGGDFYIASLSSRTIVHKGLMVPEKLAELFPDLAATDFESDFALVHSRFSTNTFPTWSRAHPYRRIAHNGEINTLSGNRNWMRSREASLESSVFGEHLQDFRPIIRPEGSDSSALDNLVDFLIAGGRSLAHVMMMLVPEAIGDGAPRPADVTGFYAYHSSLTEPWDGPAAVLFTDGKMLGGILDRNGLRPAKYVVTKSGYVVLASE
ncbi:hypothetical protein EON77_02260, partial [bacterium]